jgi:hypothetical protein
MTYAVEEGKIDDAGLDSDSTEVSEFESSADGVAELDSGSDKVAELDSGSDEGVELDSDSIEVADPEANSVIEGELAPASFEVAGSLNVAVFSLLDDSLEKVVESESKLLLFSRAIVALAFCGKPLDAEMLLETVVV